MFDALPSTNSPLWSIDETVNWIEARLEQATSDRVIFEGAFSLYGELLAGSIIAHGMINGGPLGPIDKSLWSRIYLTPYWPHNPAEMRAYGFRRYSVLCQAYKAPRQHSPPKEQTEEEMIAELLEGIVEFDPSKRVSFISADDVLDHSITVENVFFRGKDILRRWSTDNAHRARSRIGRAHAKIAQSLARMPVRGGRRGDAMLSPGPYTFADIARLLINIWNEEGDDFEYNPRTVERAVVRYYKRVKPIEI